MARSSRRKKGPGTVSRARIVECALEIADREGIDALTMRALADRLGVKPMSLYHHVPNKEAILDGIVDAVFDQITLPKVDGVWRDEVRLRAQSARSVLRKHPWAIGLVESRSNPGLATLRHHDAMLGTLRHGGFSVEMAAHAYALIDAFVFGFAVQETSLPVKQPADMPAVASSMLAEFPPDAFPHLVEFMREHVSKPGYDFGLEFDYGLDLVLDALAARV